MPNFKFPQSTKFDQHGPTWDNTFRESFALCEHRHGGESKKISHLIVLNCLEIMFRLLFKDLYRYMFKHESEHLWSQQKLMQHKSFITTRKAS